MRKFTNLISVVLLATAGFAQQRPAPAQQKPINAAPPGASRLSTVAMIDLPGRPGFDAVAMANNLIVISHTGANTIDVFDPQRRRMVAQITNIAQPRGMAVDAKNNRLFVAVANSVIDVVSSQDWEVKDSFSLQGSPDVLALSADGTRLYVGDKTNSSVFVVDTSLRKTIGTVELGGRPEAIALGDGNLVYVTVQDQFTVVSIDPQLKIAGQFKVNGSQPTGLVYDEASKRLFVAVREAVLAISSDNGTEVGRVNAQRGVDSLYFDSASHTLFASGGGSILAINTAGGFSALDELLADVKGHTIVFDASRKLLFMPGGREGRSKILIVRDVAPGATQNPDLPEAKLQ